jgi:response regulator RpfG family c-di-GMP phosphodiesterase
VSTPIQTETTQVPSKDQVIKTLIVDDEDSILTVLQTILKNIGCEVVSAASLEEARMASLEHPDISLIISDQRLQDGLGLDFLRDVKQTLPKSYRILMTGYADMEVLLGAINDGEIFRFLAKPFSAKQMQGAILEAMERIRLEREHKRLSQALVEQNVELEKSNVLLTDALGQCVNLSMNILERFDHLLASHGDRVAQWSVAIGKELGLSARELESLELAARLHDIGLISVSPELHRSQQVAWDKLQPVKQAAIMGHPKVGAELVSFLPRREVVQVIRTHHEWFNGEGYPDRLAHHHLPFLTCIMAVPDAFDELSFSRLDTRRFIEQQIGIRFHPEVVRVFLKILAGNPEYAVREREVVVSQLKAGMKITCNIYNNAGVLLIPKGNALTDRMVDSIKQFNDQDPLVQRIFVAA